MVDQSNQYFASEPDVYSFAKRVSEKVESYYNFLESSGIRRLIAKSLMQYTGGSWNTPGARSWELARGGEIGELIYSVENQYRSFADGLVNLVTAQRPSIQCSSSNSDYRSLAQAMLANGLAEYYLTEHEIEGLFRQAALAMLLEGEQSIHLTWDVGSGDPLMPKIDPATGSAIGTIKTGDVKLSLVSPLDLARNPMAPTWEAVDWVCVRSFQNKYDLAAKYSDQADEIKSYERKEAYERRVTWADDLDGCFIPVFDFYHKKSDALPNGRYLRYLNADIILGTGPLPYSSLPIIRAVPQEWPHTPFGTSKLWDLLGPQDIVNAIDTAVSTNQLNHGIGNILVPTGANINVEEIASSMNVITYDGVEKPEPLVIPQVPREMYEYKQEKIRAMETLSGINSVVRGNPSESVGADASGAKLALLQAQATQNNSHFEQEYVNLVRKTMSGIIQLLRDFGGNIPRLAKIMGKNGQYLVKEFTSGDISDVDRVQVDLGNPLMRTVSGKMAIADKLMTLPPDKAQQYINLIKTGTLEPVLEGEQSTNMRIKAENELMMEGKPAQVMFTDPHWNEIPVHLSLLDNPQLREPTPENQQIQQNILNHIQQHMQMFRNMPPDLAAMRGGQQAMQMWQLAQQAAQMQLGAPPQQPGGPGQANNTMAPGQPSPAKPPGPTGPPDQTLQNSQPQQPQMPVNPATGQRAPERLQ